VIKINTDPSPSMLRWLWQKSSRKFCSFPDVPFLKL